MQLLTGKIEDYKDQGIICKWYDDESTLFNHDKVENVIYIPAYAMDIKIQIKLLSQYSEIINKNIYMPFTNNINISDFKDLPGIYFVYTPVPQTQVDKPLSYRYRLKVKYKPEVIEEIKRFTKNYSWNRFDQSWDFISEADCHRIIEFMNYRRISYSYSYDGGMSWNAIHF